MGLLDEAIREHLELKRQRGADANEIERLEHEALGPVRRSPTDAPDALLDPESPAAGGYPVEEEVPSSLEEAPEWADTGGETAPFDDRFEPSEETSPVREWSENEHATEIAPPPLDYEPPAPPAERSSDLPRHHEIAEEWEAHERQGLTGAPGGFEPDAPAPAPPAPDPASPPPAGSGGPVFGSERQRPSEPAGHDFEQETVEHDIEAEELGDPPADKPQEGEDVLEETPDFLQDTPDHDRLWFEQRPPRDFDFDG